MNVNPTLSAVNKHVNTSGGNVWHRLHSEREDICEALLKDSRTATDADLNSSRAATSPATWHRGLLQARLTKVDDALDRLMSGSYGNCTGCGKWIEDSKLEFDSAVEFCLACWERMQTKH